MDVVSKNQYYYELASTEESFNAFPLNRLGSVLTSFAKDEDLVVDIGCGMAHVLGLLPKQIRYVGIDQSQNAITDASKKWIFYPRARFIRQDSPIIPINDNEASLIISFFSIEHLMSPRTTLEEIVRILKPGGYLFIAAPNMEFPLAWPNALRHKGTSYRIWFTVLRTLDYVKRMFGSYSFRVLPENITSAKKIYEKKDDDLWHMASSFEIIRFLEKNGFILEAFFKEKELVGWRRFITYLPTLRYYGTPLAAVLKKK